MILTGIVDVFFMNLVKLTPSVRKYKSVSSDLNAFIFPNRGSRVFDSR